MINNANVWPYPKNKLDWANPTIKKNWCLLNTTKLFRTTKLGGVDATHAIPFGDKHDIYQVRVGDVLVLGGTNPVMKGPGITYGHIGVITMVTDSVIHMSDGDHAYPNLVYPVDKIAKGPYSIISPKKMIELGATRITLNDLTITELMNNYKQIFLDNFPQGSTIYKDLDGASNDLTNPQQIAYFIAIGLERLKANLTTPTSTITK